MELKQFSRWFVLAALLVASSDAAADVLPPPPPPPPGANPDPRPMPSSGALEAPPPPPPGVNIEPPSPNSPDKPAPVKTRQATTQAPTTSIPIDGVPPPPPPPEGVSAPVPAPKKPPPAPPRQTEDSASRAAALAKQRAIESGSRASGSWYGWQSLLGLIPVYGFYLGGSLGDEELLYIPAVIGGVIVTPIAHWVHGNRRRGWLSFGLNIGTQFIGSVAEGADGAMVGLGLWSLLDIGFLHFEDPPPPKVTKSSFPSSFAVVPDVRPGYKGLSLVGQF